MEGSQAESGATMSRDEELARDERLWALEEEVKTLRERITTLESKTMAQVGS